MTILEPKFVTVFLCAFVAAVALGSVYVVPQKLFWDIVFIGLVCAVVVLISSRVIGLAMFCAILGAAFGLWYVNRSFGPNEYQDYIGQTIDVEGVIAGDPVTQDKSQTVTLLPDGFTQYLRASLYTAIPGAQQGDRVWIRGQVQLPENFSEFDYIGYLQRWGVYAELKKPRVIVLRRAATSSWKGAWRIPLRNLHDYIVKQTKVYPTNEGSLILGILIGERSNMPDEITQAFKTTGLTHIIAVSGFNMTIIATACGALVWYIGRRATGLLTFVVVFAFTVITGATASVVRAAIMSVLMITAQLLGRQYSSLHALLVVCAIMVLQNPRIVIWDIGFQLSVAATVGVLVAFRLKANEEKKKLLNHKTQNHSALQAFLSDTLRPTLGAIIFTAPIIAFHFQTFSLIAPLANLIVLPSVTWIMLLSGLALLPVIGNAFVYPAQMLTSAALFATEKLSHVPYASIPIHLPLWTLGFYYGLLIIFIIAKSG